MNQILSSPAIRAAFCALFVSLLPGLTPKAGAQNQACCNLILPTVAQQNVNPPISETIFANGPTSYTRISLNNVPAGFSITNNVNYLGWCIDSFHEVNNGGTYFPRIYCPSDTAGLMSEGIPTANFDKINYILNHKQSPQNTGTSASDIQDAIWHYILGGGPSQTQLENGQLAGFGLPAPNPANVAAYIAAADAFGVGFTPGPGNVAAVVLALPPSLNGGAQNQAFIIELPCCTGQIGDFVWQDNNSNGCQDAGEPGIPNVIVDLYSGCPATTRIATTTTDATGHYLFTGLCGGDYTVRFHTPSGFTHTVSGSACGGVPGDPHNPLDSNCACTGVVDCDVCVHLPNNGTDLTIDCGYIPPCTGTIGDFVWNDLNGNGCQDAGEPGIPSVIVDLYSGCPATTLVGTTTTDATGHYLFTGLCGGSYSVRFHTPGGFTHTVSGSACGGTPGDPHNPNDSNCQCGGAVDCDVCVTLPNNGQDLTIDCGYTTCPIPPCVDPGLGLGAAANCTVFQLTNHKVSITGPAGGIVGNICMAPNSALSMSGDEYVTGTIKLGPGATFTNSSHSFPNVMTNVNLSAEIAAANARATSAAALLPTQTFVKLDGNAVTTITGVVGLNVIKVTDVTLSGKQIRVTGPVGAKFIFNVSGKFTLTGGGAGPQIRAAGGVQPKDILYNIIGSGSDVAFSGGGGGVNCCAAIVDGTLLAPMRKINLAPGLVNGELISGLDISIVSGSSVRCPVCP